MNENQVRVDVQWLSVASVESLEWHDPRLGKYFSASPHVGLFNKFRMPDRFQVVPYSLTPRDGFYRVLLNSVDRLSSVSGGPHLPFVLAGDDGRFPCELTSISGELFPGGVLVARVKARSYFEEPEHWLTSEYRKLQNLRTPASTGVVDNVIRHIYSLALGDRNIDARRFSSSGYFLIKISLPCSSLEETRDKNWQVREAASLLVGAPNAAELGQHVVDSLSSLNEPLNQKAEAELLLMNQQGALYLLPGAGYTQWPFLTDLAVVQV